MGSGELSVTVSDHVAVVELRRPPTNFFDHALVGELADAVLGLDTDDACRVVVLCSEGKHFCAGANFGEGGLGQERIDISAAIYREAVRLFDAGKPIIAAVQGAAVGGGLGLACAADFRVTDENSRFAGNFALLGFHHGFGLTVTLPEIVGRQAAADLLYTGRRINGRRAFEIGLVDRLVEPGRQREEAVAWAREIAAAAPLAVASIRRTLRGDLAARVRAALDHELAEQSWLWSTEDCAEGVAANLERRPAVFSGR